MAVTGTADQPSGSAARREHLWWRGQWALWFGPGWYGVRVPGWQFDVKNHRLHRPLFSERYGYGKRDYRHIGPFCLRFGRLAKP